MRTLIETKKIIDEIKIGTIKNYVCDICGHNIVMPKYKTEVKCYYCGTIKKSEAKNV